MFRSYTNKCKYNLRVKHGISEVIDIFTSEDMEKYATQVPDAASYEFYEWCIFHYNKDRTLLIGQKLMFYQCINITSSQHFY